MDAAHLLGRAAEPHEARAAARGIALDIAPCPAGVMIDADESVVIAMLGHLLDNALSFTQPGGQVRLSLQQDATGISFAVADNGPGIAAAEIERILRPFEQAGDVTHHAEGSGLGLTLVKAFAERHGGMLAIQTSPGEGFTAKVTLPLTA
jgi:cell cycle sensor histidine kinase DivJ